MQNSELSHLPGNAALHSCPNCEEEEDQLVVFELVVPRASKVPAPRPRLEVAKLLVQQAAVTSTVSEKSLTELRANNTTHSLGWCVTATLAAPPAARQHASW